MIYNALILCSTRRSDSNIIDMVENIFSSQGFETISIGSNPYVKIELNYLEEILGTSNVIVIIITNSYNLDIINRVLKKNYTIFNIKKKPVMVFCEPFLYNELKGKGSHPFILNHLNTYPIDELTENIEIYVKEFKNAVDSREFVKDMGKIGLIFGGIGIGVGLLFSLFKGEDENED
ncbi:hypothetical protein LCGC14_2630660 [marine sediment metagenome]|uniref:TIR domain-containing protein n=1 Tax=marine sediment metagenome TaxID=412755 RepID=A0A0F9CBC6_9ZZZZ